MYSLDMAAACVFVMEKVNINYIIELNKSFNNQPDYHSPHFLNIGTEEEISIKDLALKIKSMIGFKGEIVFDETQPDGTVRKTINVRLLRKLGYNHDFNLDKGLLETYSNYIK
jgi:GDP-L-fucose synthase